MNINYSVCDNHDYCQLYAEATHDDDDDNGGGGVGTIAVAETTHDDDDNGCSGVISANDFGRREAHKLRVRVGPTSW